MRDKYCYVDPDLVALYDAEAAARGEVRPPPRKKRHTANRNKEQSFPSSPYSYSSPSTPRGFAIKPSMTPQQPQPQPYGHPEPARWPALHHDPDLQLRPLLQVPPTHHHPAHVRQNPPERFTFEMGSSTTDKKKFLITLRDDLMAKGHVVRDVSIVGARNRNLLSSTLIRTSRCVRRYGRSSWGSRSVTLLSTTTMLERDPL